MTPGPAVALALIISCSVALGGCKQSYPAYNTRFRAFDTLVDLSIIDVEPAKAERVVTAIKADFEYMESAWHVRNPGPLERVNNAIINAGGDLRAIGDRDGHPWRVAIRRPSGSGVFATVNVTGDESVFTSGDYERNFVYRGQNYHHILDPRTGYPAVGARAVTVLHKDAATAGAAATALFVAGAKHWHRVTKAMGIRYVLLVDSADTLHMNPAMAKRVRLLEPDRDVELSPPLI